jgi:HK97 gp10 family phage protein
MAATTSQVYGLSDIGKVLEQLPDRIANRLLQTAVSAGARVQLKAIKARAPLHEGHQSPSSEKYGSILENLSVEPMRVLRNTSARGARVTTRNAFWAMFYELGTAHQPARPFMRPGFDESTTEATSTVAGSLITGVEREAAKLAGEYGTAKRSLGVR